MLKSLIVSGAVATTAALASPVLAGEVYVNPEYNAGFSGADFVGSSLELHAGFQEVLFTSKLDLLCLTTVLTLNGVSLAKLAFLPQ